MQRSIPCTTAHVPSSPASVVVSGLYAKAAAAAAVEPAAVAEGGRASGGGSVSIPSSTSARLLIITSPSALQSNSTPLHLETRPTPV